MKHEYREMVVKRPKFMFGENREYLYSEDPAYPKFRLLLSPDEFRSEFEFHNTCIEFQLAFDYKELSPTQRVLKAAFSFDGYTQNSGVGEGVRMCRERGMPLVQLLDLLSQIGAHKQREILSDYQDSREAEINRAYYDCKPDVLELAIAFAQENMEEFVKLRTL